MTVHTSRLTISPVERLAGEVVVPGDKSISHRAAVLGALAHGETRARGFLQAEDCLSTVTCLQAVGAEVRLSSDGELLVMGKGGEGLSRPEKALDAGNSGTTVALLCGLLAGCRFDATVTGDASLRRRPQRRLATPLRAMGAEVHGEGEQCFPPLLMCGGPLRGIDWLPEPPSAQVKSALLLAGLAAEGTTRVREPIQTRDHTERMLQAMGGQVYHERDDAVLEGGQALAGCEIDVPGDMSSAAFFFCAAAIVPGGVATVQRLGTNPLRTGILDALRAFGARVLVTDEQVVSGEPRATVTVQAHSLRGIELGGADIPRLVDEIPIICAVAACAEGRTRIRDAAQLRHKESDRLHVMAEELAKFGVKVGEHPDGLEIEGRGPLRGARCQSQGDHRIAMALAILGLRTAGETTVEGVDCIITSFPGFEVLLNQLAPECVRRL